MAVEFRTQPLFWVGINSGNNMQNSATQDADDFVGGARLDSVKREALREVIRERSYSQGETKTLASGRESNFYFDMRLTTSQPEALEHIADLFLPILYTGECDYIGGLETGAIPVLLAVAMPSVHPPNDKPLPLVRLPTAAKGNGTKRRPEGQNISDLAGKTAVMVEDVTTTGGSVLKAILEARANGVIITRVITIVDRLEGAAENLAKEGVELICLFDANDF